MKIYRCTALRRWSRSWCLCILASGLAAAQPAVETRQSPVDPLAPYLTLPPGERYWQLAFVLEVTEGIDPSLLERMRRQSAGTASGPIDPESLQSYQGAGIRIADSGRILDGVAQLARYRLAAEPEIRAELKTLENRYPELFALFDREALLEEALLVRLAVADSLVARLPDSGDGAGFEAYNQATLRTRNDFEYLAFERSVDRMTDRAIEETEGRLDALHRTVNDEYDLQFLRERVQSAEDMNEAAEAEHRRYALQRTLRTLMILAPIINRYFYYD